MKSNGKSPAKEAAAASGKARERIVSTARGHFLAHGFRNVTMDDLAAELGMSKKTFYAHFDSKLALVEAVMNHKISQVESDLERIIAQPGVSFRDALKQLLACLQQHTGEIQPSFLRDVRRDAIELFNIVEQRRAALIQRVFSKLFMEGRKSGMVRDDVPVKMIIEVLLAATSAIMNPAKLDDLKLTPRQGYSAILEIVLGGALTSKGRSAT